MSQGATKEGLSSISGVRGIVCAKLVSGIVTANRKYLEEFATARTSIREHAFIHKFPKEAPTQEDWITWIQFWKQHTVGTFKQSTPLGEWIHPTHRVWECYYDQEVSSLRQRTASGTAFYVPAPGYNRTRSGKCHIKSWVSEDTPEGC